MNLEEGKEYQLTKELMPLLNLTAQIKYGLFFSFNKII